MVERKHPTLPGEIQRVEAHEVAFSFGEPQNVEVLAPVAPEPEKKDALIRQPDANAGHPRKIGHRSRAKAARRFAMQIVGSEEYRQMLWTRLREGTLPAAVEVALLQYSFGKPVARQEIDANNRLTITVARPW